MLVLQHCASVMAGFSLHIFENSWLDHVWTLLTFAVVEKHIVWIASSLLCERLHMLLQHLGLILTWELCCTSLPLFCFFAFAVRFYKIKTTCEGSVKILHSIKNMLFKYFPKSWIGWLTTSSRRCKIHVAELLQSDVVFCIYVETVCHSVAMWLVPCDFNEKKKCFGY